MEKAEKIFLHQYAISKWIKLEGFTEKEVTDMIASISRTEQFDGYDPDDQTLCLTFKEYIPNRVQDIRVCKVKNKNVANHRIKLIKQIVSSKYPNIYFNLNRLTIKKLR